MGFKSIVINGFGPHSTWYQRKSRTAGASCGASSGQGFEQFMESRLAVEDFYSKGKKVSKGRGKSGFIIGCIFVGSWS